MKRMLATMGVIAIAATSTIASAQRAVAPGRSLPTERETIVPKPINPIPARFPQQITAHTAVTEAASLIPECDVVTVWDNIKKVWVTKQNGKVRFKMVGSAPAGAQVADGYGNWMVPFAANSVTPGIDVSGYVAMTADTSWNPFSSPVVLNGQLHLFGGNPIVIFNWPTGLSLWRNYRWATNRCNNQPIKPLFSEQSAAVLNDIKTLIP